MIPALTAAVLLAALASAQDESPTIAWHDDLDAARALARTEHKPLLVAFRCET